MCMLLWCFLEDCVKIKCVVMRLHPLEVLNKNTSVDKITHELGNKTFVLQTKPRMILTTHQELITFLWFCFGCNVESYHWDSVKTLSHCCQTVQWRSGMFAVANSFRLFPLRINVFTEAQNFTSFPYLKQSSWASWEVNNTSQFEHHLQTIDQLPPLNKQSQVQKHANQQQ